MYAQIILLLFALHSLSAYTIVQIELKNGTEVSEVKELTDNTAEFISAESRLPILREIIFVVDKCLGTPGDQDSTIKKETPQESPIELDGSLRSFTNGHGYQFANWELVDEHQSQAHDKAEDKTDNDSESDGSDADDYDDTTGDETDKPDDYYKAKILRNRMFDKMKEKYHSRTKGSNVDPTEKVREKRQIYYQNMPGPQTQQNIEPTAIPDYTNRMLVNRPPYDNSQKVMSPVLIDEHGNILYDNMNTVYSGGRQIGSIPGTYGMNVNNDQGYYLNHMQNEPIYNQHIINQPVQQRPIESYTLNNNPYKQIIQSNTPNVELRNFNQIPTSDIYEIDNTQKSNQVPNYELLKEMENRNKNVTQKTDIEKTINSNEANKAVRHNKEMLHNVNQMSKTIGSITEKVKDRFASINGILNTPEGRKLLTHYEMIMAGDKKEIANDIAAAAQYVHAANYTAPDFKNITKYDKLEVKPNTTIAMNNVGNENMIESNCSNKGNIANSSLIEVAKNMDIKINEDTKNQVENTVISNTVNTTTNNTTTCNETKSIEKVKNKESTLDSVNIESFNETSTTEDNGSTTNQTVIENKIYNNPEYHTATVILTTTCNETMSIEKDKESTLDSVNIESLNETSTTEDNESTTKQTVIENKIYNPEYPTATVKLTTTCNETTSIEKDKKKISTLDPVNIESFNETSTIEDNKSTTNQTGIENKIHNYPDYPSATEILATNCNETTNIKKDKNNKSRLDPVNIESFNETSTTENNEATTNQTIIENKYNNPKYPTATVTLTVTCNETTSIEKDKNKESRLNPVHIESFNETSSTEVKEESKGETLMCAEFIEEIKTDTSVASKISEENCSSKEKCNADDDNKTDKKYDNLNLDDLFDKDEFWDWLSKWTSAYMEILQENIEIIVKEEVTKQLYEIFWKKEETTTLE
ncbi:homeobox-like protein HDP1 [Maniola hyperantus]|uniref:homeobox-like protein HDP1 n=1 Tax=Aphantopus hyperantus TaxID=2795564 RepID=UPI0037482FD7